jgi:hypothetical protein
MELQEVLDQIGLPGANGSDLGEGYLSVADLATWIGGVSQSTVRRWLRDGRFPGAWQLDNGGWRIPRAAALEFVEKRKPTASQACRVRRRTGRYGRDKFIRRFQSKEAV